MIGGDSSQLDEGNSVLGSKGSETCNYTWPGSCIKVSYLNTAPSDLNLNMKTDSLSKDAATCLNNLNRFFLSLLHVKC